MDAVTYPDEKVAEFVNNRLIPLRVLFDHEPLARDFNLKWTPTLITLDADGNEHHRSVGFLAVEEIIPSLLLGIGKSCFETGRFDVAISVFDEILAEHANSGSAAEAIYFKGVALYKSTHDATPLRAAYEELRLEHPESEWTKRAYPYRLIPIEEPVHQQPKEDLSQRIYEAGIHSV